MKNILIVDDEHEMLNSLGKILSHETDYKLDLIQDPNQAMKEIRQKEYELIITDLKMGQISGLDILKNAMEHFPHTPVIMISGYGTIEASVEAIQHGAFDFIEKPFTSKKLLECINKALDRKDIDSESSNEISELSGIIYSSAQMQNVIDSIKNISSQNMNILILGESGVGKELVARAIHK